MTDQQQKAWLEHYAPMAQASMAGTGVPASVTLAQAILESSDVHGNWGCSGVALKCSNFFGIKARHNKQGAATEPYVQFQTTEFIDKVAHLEPADFAKFPSVQDSFIRHAQLLSSAHRYEAAMKVKHNPDDFAVKLQECRYSTSPTYAATLSKLIRDHDLTQYDVEPKPALAQADGDSTPIKKEAHA